MTLVVIEARLSLYSVQLYEKPENPMIMNAESLKLQIPLGFKDST